MTSFELGVGYSGAFVFLESSRQAQISHYKFEDNLVFISVISKLLEGVIVAGITYISHGGLLFFLKYPNLNIITP